MTSEERRLNYSCSESAMYMNDDSSKMLGDGIIYWREHLELYQDIAIYVPLATLALYFAVKWIWFGKVANEQPDQLQQTLWQYRKSILWGVAILLGLGVLYVLRPERTIEILMKGAVQGGIVGGVVALVMWYRRRRK
jgi:hypothetical protein